MAPFVGGQAIPEARLCPSQSKRIEPSQALPVSRDRLWMRRNSAKNYLKMDTRFLARDFATDFIKLYETFPCLWKIKSKDYANRSLKKEAYDQLIRFCKKTYPGADLKFVKHKIQSMRNSFRKELRKVNASKRNHSGANDVYEPTLWYYKLLLFTKDQELPEESTENVEPDCEDVSQDSEECSQIAENENSPPATASRPQQPNTTLKLTSKKRKHNFEERFFNTCISALRTETTLDEFDLVGRNIGTKLRQMKFRQRVLAESLMHQIVTKGLFNEITRNTVLQERDFVIHNTLHSLPVTSYTSTPLASPANSNNDHDTKLASVAPEG